MEDEKEIIGYSLFKKIQCVSNEVNTISKNMTVGSGSYQYKAVQDLDVTLKVKEAETKYRIISIPIKQELVKSEVIKTLNTKGNESIVYVDIIKMTIRVINLDNTSEFIEVEAFGRGLDSGDKGFGKASTYARKYALLNVYKIATGEDPDKEKDQKMETQVVPSNKRIEVTNYLLSNINACNSTLKRFNKGSVDDLSESEISQLYSGMIKRGYIEEKR